MATQSTQNNPGTSERAGLLSLSAGTALLSAGVAFLLAVGSQDNAMALSVLKGFGKGLAGVFFLPLPFLLMWLGATLCVSAKRSVSFRQVLLSWGLYLAMLALFTLTSSVQGNGTLMDYVGMLNVNYRKAASPGGMGAYLSAAFEQYGGHLQTLLGGGWLGMLIAFPCWRMLGTVGAVTLLALLFAMMLCYFVHFNPVSAWHRLLESRRAPKTAARDNKESRAEQENAAIPQESPARPARPRPEHEQPAPESKQPAYVYPDDDIEPHAGGLRRAAEWMSRLAPDALMSEPAAEDGGFTAVPADMDDFYRETGEWEQNERRKRQEQRDKYAAMRAEEAAEIEQREREEDSPAFFEDEPVAPATIVHNAAKQENYTEAFKQPDTGYEPAPYEAFDKPREEAAEEDAAVRGGEIPLPQTAFSACEAPETRFSADEAPEVDEEERFADEAPEDERAPLPWEGGGERFDLDMDDDLNADLPFPDAQEDWDMPDAVPSPRPAAREGRVHTVHTDAAIELGKRISVPKPTELPGAALDGSGHRGPEHQPMAAPKVPYTPPASRLLSAPPEGSAVDHTEKDNQRAERLIRKLDSFGIPVEIKQIVHGPAITRFAIRMGDGVKVSRLRNVMDDLAVELLSKNGVRAEVPIPGTSLIGIEVSNEKTTTVFLKEVLESPKLQGNPSPTTVALGRDVAGAPITCDLMDMPHLLIAGATGSGKSVCINSIITSLLYRATPDDVRLILVDPKFVELQPYNGCPHLLLPVISDDKKVVAALDWVCEEMDERYRKMQRYNVRNIDGYNERIAGKEEKMPKIVMIIDEMADLIATCGKAVEEYIKRITAKARAAGICLVLATQRPSVNVITGVIKANIPSRIAFQVSSMVDSRTILDAPGAENLLGYGDMLYAPRSLPAGMRVQGCFISDRDVEAITDYVKEHNPTCYNSDIMEYLDKAAREDEDGYDDEEEGMQIFDDKLPEAIEMAVEAGQMSISMLQRVLRVGYGRAGRLIDEMEKRKIIGESEGTKPRKTLMTREEYNRLAEIDSPRLR